MIITLFGNNVRNWIAAVSSCSYNITLKDGTKLYNKITAYIMLLLGDIQIFSLLSLVTQKSGEERDHRL
jgi:hypothetical protein